MALKKSTKISRDEREGIKKNSTLKRKAFVQEYLLDLNGTQAAIRAGYSPKTARQIADNLLSYIDIKEDIEKEMQKRSKRTTIDIDYVLTNIKEIGERCMQKRPITAWNAESKTFEVVLDENGKSVWEFDASNALKAQELLGKHLNMWTDKKLIMGKVTLEALVASAGIYDE